jgi:hypothetical protein
VNVQTVLGWLAKLWAVVSPWLRQKAAAPQPTAAPADPLQGCPRLDAGDYEKRLRHAVADEKYRDRKDDPTTKKDERATFCNVFTRDVCAWFGWKDFEATDRDQAGEITRFMSAHPTRWRLVSPEDAARCATLGHLVVAGQVRKPQSSDVPGKWYSTGHVCIVAPGQSEYSNKWSMLVPVCANVGGSNWYGKPLSFAFGKDQPELFLYLG